jgi:hypothetical protein
VKPGLHRSYTLKAALKCSFSEEEASKIAEHAVEFDRHLIFKPWAHFRLSGAGVFAWVFLKLAVITRNLKLLGWAVHAAQDAVSHGNLYPWNHRKVPDIDEVERGSGKEKAVLEETERILKKYKSKH